MTEDAFFSAQFPGSAPRLEALRDRDKEFDQMCADYQEVFLELARGPQAVAGTQPRYLADLAESLADLRNSIERQLLAFDPAPDDAGTSEGKV